MVAEDIKISDYEWWAEYAGHILELNLFMGALICGSNICI